MTDILSTIAQGPPRVDPKPNAPTQRSAGWSPPSRGSAPNPSLSGQSSVADSALDRTDPAPSPNGARRRAPGDIYSKFEVDGHSVGVVVRMVDAATNQVVRVIPLGHAEEALELAERARARIAASPDAALGTHAAVQSPAVARLLEG